jgi:hypothetical protein
VRDHSRRLRFGGGQLETFTQDDVRHMYNCTPPQTTMLLTCVALWWRILVRLVSRDSGCCVTLFGCHKMLTAVDMIAAAAAAAAGPHHLCVG